MVTKELIERFFRNECTIEERKRVWIYIKTNPNALDEYFNETEWENFKVQERLSETLSQKLFESVSNKLYRKKKAGIIFRLAAAASVIIVTGLGWLLMNKFGKLSDNKPKNSLIAQCKLVQQTNTTNRLIAIVLKDSSIVELAPNSTVKFYEPFVVSNKRNIQLFGKASFKVAKDKTKPFTVYSDGIATTALGTYFTVNSFDTSNIISITLYEGKVVVQSVDSADKKWGKKYYLLPGNEAVYNKKTLVVSLRHAEIKEHKHKLMVIASGEEDISNSVTIPDWYVFNSSSLSFVFTQLSTYYKKKIYYYPNEIANRYYSGKIEKTDSLENILNDIALLNNLIISKKDGAYFIQREVY